MRTLLAGYLLSSQGDRMLMAHSVEGRFPFLDPQVAALAESLPDKYRLMGLDEKHVIKRAAADIVPREIRERTKQPYRAPDAVCFISEEAREWVEEILSPASIAAAGVFDAGAVTRLWRKCLARGAHAPLSNTDNMALVGVISTQLVHRQLIARTPSVETPASIGTLIDRVTPPSGAAHCLTAPP